MSARPTTNGQELWSAVAHDLRTPLAVIAGFAELLLTRDDEPTRREAAEQILAASKRVSSDLDDLVTLLAIAEDSLEVDPEPVPLLDVVMAAATGHSGQTSDAVVVPESTPVVRADRGHLARVVATVLSYARRGRPTGNAPVVTVAARGGYGLVSVELDDRANGEPGRLDLLVAQRLVELHGGSLTVQSGEGSTASLTLSVPVAERSPARARRVLIIDDDRAIRALLRATLPDGDYEIVEAHEGGIGLQLALTHELDLVLLDWRLPGTSGAYVLRELKRERSDLPVIVLTASTDADAQQLAAELGANTFLTKPFSPLELLDAVERLVT